MVRFYLTNTANTRVFKVALPGARIKLVGGDSGHVEHEQFVEDVILAPSERVVIDVLFDQPGERDDGTSHARADLSTGVDPRWRRSRRSHRSPSSSRCSERTRDMAAERERIAAYFDAEPDKTLGFLAEMDMGAPEGDGPVVYSCPMHPEVVQRGAGALPGVRDEAAGSRGAIELHLPDASGGGQRSAWALPRLRDEAAPVTPRRPGGGGHEHGEEHGHHMHEHGAHEHHDHSHEGHDHAAAGGIEWEDDMVEINRLTTPANMRWKLIDKATGDENAAIDWRFRVGDQVKIRLLNEMAGDHPMHHPFHVHGAGRFLVLSRDGVVEPNLVWKDTVLGPHRRDRRHPARRHQPGAVDGSLPHRRASRERDDVQLQGDAMSAWPTLGRAVPGRGRGAA